MRISFLLFFQLVSFAIVKANLLYIQEEDLRPEFQNKLCMLYNSKLPLYIIVQLKLSSKDFRPLINNLLDIRKDKAKKKIDNWAKFCHPSGQNIIINILEKDPTFSKVSIDFTGVHHLNIYSLKDERKQILPLLKKSFTIDQLSFNYY